MNDIAPSSFTSRLSKAWNTFIGRDRLDPVPYTSMGPSSSYRATRPRFGTVNAKTVINPILTRIAVDVSTYDFRHVKNDDDERFVEEIKSGLNDCLNLEANIDQSSRDFIQDVAMTMMDDGVSAIIPIDTTNDPDVTGNYDILSMRVGTVVTWYPQHVTVSVWNDRKGIREEITLSKSRVAIVPNPFYPIMNEPNSVLKRLLNKLALLDAVDEQSNSGKLDILIQLPYVTRTETKKTQAEIRRKDIEDQLKGSQYGVAYIDSSESITQLNRPAENSLRKQVDDLTKLLYNQLGLTESVFDGTASEEAMLNYYNRTIEPIATAIKLAMKRTFLTKTARTQNQSIEWYRDPLKLVPVSKMGELANSLVRNELVTANEFRGSIGYKPSVEAKADVLRNPNMPFADDMEANSDPNMEPTDEVIDESSVTEDQLAQDGFDQIDATIDSIFDEIEADEDAES